MLFTMLVGGPPHTIPTRRDARFEAICDGRITEVLEAWECTELIPPLVCDLLNRIFQEAPGARASITELEEHAWLQ